MSHQWRILVVEDDENLNQMIVNSLRKDAYVVQGAKSGAEAISMLWSEEYDVVIGDLKTPGADGFELLQWLRVYRPNCHMIMLASPGSPLIRASALESGVVSYLEKPVHLHLLKEELRRLLQQTGFSANLDSFDLLDVVQIITLNRKNTALLVDTGLGESGILRFQGGDLIWAEYGVLRGEEAFFALAAYKDGTVSYQPWNEQISPNVTLPLSRLIFQALQYREKYAAMQQPTDALTPPVRIPLAKESGDDGLAVGQSGSKQDISQPPASSYPDSAQIPLTPVLRSPVVEQQPTIPIKRITRDILQRQEAPRQRNYPALEAALQTLGFSIAGFIATAVLSLDGQLIAQVAVDDLDISSLYAFFCSILQAALQTLDRCNWGYYEDTVITSSDRYILLRMLGGDREAIQVLITTREADPLESLEVMANVEGAIAAALR